MGATQGMIDHVARWAKTLEKRCRWFEAASVGITVLDGSVPKDSLGVVLDDLALAGNGCTLDDLPSVQAVVKLASVTGDEELRLFLLCLEKKYFLSLLSSQG